MMCARCRKPIERLSNGAYKRCCSKSYYSDSEPLARDSWWPVRKHRGMYLYEPWPGVKDYGGLELPV